MHSRFCTTLGVAALAAVATVGCSQSPQDKYDDAVSSLNNSQQDLDKAQSRVQNMRQQVQDAQQSYQQAQKKLDSAQQDVQKARQGVQQDATDQVLFRVLQRDVLNKNRFSKAAISVGVQQRVVTLTGSVPDQGTRDDAVKMVKQQPGVAHVVDQLTISKSGQDAPNPSNGGNNSN